MNQPRKYRITPHIAGNCTPLPLHVTLSSLPPSLGTLLPPFPITATATCLPVHPSPRSPATQSRFDPPPGKLPLDPILAPGLPKIFPRSFFCVLEIGVWCWRLGAAHESSFLHFLLGLFLF